MNQKKPQPQPIFVALHSLYAKCGAGILGRALVESLLAHQYHGELTVRLGVNQDQTMTVFSVNQQLSALMHRMVERGGTVRVNTIPTFTPREFSRLLGNEDFKSNVLQAIGAPDRPETPADAYPNDTGGWVSESAKAYVERIAAGLDDEAQRARLREELKAEDSVNTNARTRILLNGVLGWKADKLNHAVEQISGPVSDLVALYALCKGTALGRVLIETVAAIQEHEGTSVRLSANQDGSLSVFCSDKLVGKLVAEAISRKGAVHIGLVGEMEVDAFAACAWQSSKVLNRPALGGPDETDERPWPEPAARAYVTSVADRLADTFKREEPSPTRREIYPENTLSGKKNAVLRAALKESDAVTSEGRFRALLHEVMHWGTEKLDEAVAQVWGAEAIDAAAQAVWGSESDEAS
jgi:hypothetical protein